MRPTSFESINSRQFQDRVVLTKADALVKISRPSIQATFLSFFLDRLTQSYQGKLKFFELDPLTVRDFAKPMVLATLRLYYFLEKVRWLIKFLAEHIAPSCLQKLTR